MTCPIWPQLFTKKPGVKRQGILDFKHGRLYTINLCVFDLPKKNNDIENHQVSHDEIWMLTERSINLIHWRNNHILNEWMT